MANTQTLHLPIHDKKDAIIDAIRKHAVVVVSGDTGSGKTTQLPKICHEAVLGKGLIGCTQPRRVAAVSLAKRVADELGCDLGGLVGVQVRFLDQLSATTRIKFMTDGILLSETRGDRQLKKYDVIIVDEAHERTLNIDFTLGYLKNLLAKRRDLKVVISSATLDVERFSKFFENAPVVEIEGRTFPVEDHFLPASGKEDMPTHVARAVDWIRETDTEGDILVFLPGEREIQETTDMLTGRQWPKTAILPFYARLSLKEQQAVFQSIPGKQRLVLATNVAETSITIPGIIYVIDVGLARISRYEPRSRVQQLQTEKVSQASARQRRGRCGRVSNGICVKLYDSEDLEKRPAYTDPEIRRTSLAGVILQMKSLRLPPVEEFSFLDPPQRRLVSEGHKQLQELLALDENRRLTEVGREMARMPVDPALSKMLLFARDEHHTVLPWVLIIVAAMATQDPRERPRAKRDQADQAHKQWEDRESDFLSRLHLWCGLRAHITERGRPQHNQLRRFCGKHYLNYRRVMEWLGVARELAGLMRVKTLPLGKQTFSDGDYLPIHQSLMAGIARGTAQRGEQRDYRTGGDQAFLIFPASALAKRKKLPPWVLGFEIVETSRLFARQVAAIEPEWLEDVVPHLCRYHYSDPSWDSKQGAVYAQEHVSCVSFRIISGRKVHFGRIHPEEARKTFISQALVPGDLHTRGTFREANRETIATVKQREVKLRRPNSLFCEDAVFEFYEALLPLDICTSKGFETWRQTVEEENPELLHFSEQDICYPHLTPFEDRDYPDDLIHNDLAYPVYYAHNPGEPNDGITIGCNLTCLGNLPDWLGEWLVPAYLKEKVVLLIKGLRKECRIACQPLDQMAEDFVNATEQAGLLTDKLACYLRQRIGHHIEVSELEGTPLPPHLKPFYWIGDEEGNDLATGNDLAALRQRLAPKLAQWFDQQTSQWEQQGLSHFPCDALIESVELSSAVAYPALVDEGKTVGIRYFANVEHANTHHRLGLVRLVELSMTDQVDYVRKHFPLGQFSHSLLNMLGQGGKSNSEDLLTITIDKALGGKEDRAPNVRDADTMASKLAELRSELYPLAQALADQLEAFISEYEVVSRLVEQHRIGPYADNFRDITNQLDDLFAYRFLLRGWADRLKHYPRYLKAIRARIDRMLGSPPAKDMQKQQRLMPFQCAYAKLSSGWDDQPLELPFALRQFGWQLQEFRLSVFTPEVGALFKVSEKRLQKALDALVQ